MNKIFIFVFILFTIAEFSSCGLREKAEQKINEKIDQTVDEKLKKIDSALQNTGTMLDTMKNKSFESMDSVKYKLDSVSKEIKEMIDRQKELLKK
ncbi:MAG: hypothetical protein JSS91_12405 [Bacteroidetes bacterium]|nr:hypothetical protein [Bacteroidota bacterium]